MTFAESVASVSLRFSMSATSSTAVAIVVLRTTNDSSSVNLFSKADGLAAIDEGRAQYALCVDKKQARAVHLQ